MNSVYSYPQIHREIYNVITFYILRLKKNYSTADELQQLDYFKDSAVFFEFLMVVYSHGDSLKGNKRHELWDRLLRFINEKGWRPSEEKLHLGFLERRGYEKDSLQYKFYYSPQCSEFLDNICHQTSDLLGVIIDRSSHEVKVIPSDRDLNLLESMLKPYVENLMPSPDKNERTRQVILEKFEQAFKNNIHLKIVCMDVEHFSPKQTDKTPSWQSIKRLRKRLEFENKVSIAHSELSFFIRKFEYAGNGKFKYLYIFVFNQ